MLYRRKTSWTAEQDAELWHLYANGVSKMRLSVRLRRTTRAVAVRLSALRKQSSAQAANSPPVSQSGANA